MGRCRADRGSSLLHGQSSAVGVRPSRNPHRPCSFNCQATQHLATAYDNLRAKVGSQPDQETLAEVLSWPVEWSSLHGIVEVKLPVLKLCYDGDATATLYKVAPHRWCAA